MDLGLGIKNLSRHIQLFTLFYIIQSEINPREIKKFLKFFLFMTIVHSICNLSIFISEAGKVRAFGIAGVSFSDMLVASLIICYSFYLYMEEGKNRLKYVVVFFVLLGALFATQTRGAMVSFLLSYIFASIIVLKKNTIMGWVDVRKSLWKLTISMGILILLAFLLFEPLLANLSHKFYPQYQPPIEGTQETIQLRFLLWVTALRAFLTHPLLGIGVGQFTVINLVLPNIRFLPLFHQMAGLDPHNIVLAYLSQTGILGLGSLLYLMLSFLRVGWNTQRRSITREELSLSTALLGIMFFVAASSFYAGAWFYSVSGMEFMLFLAFLVILHRSLITPGKIKITSK